MKKRVLLYVGPARLLKGWLAEQLKLCAGKGNGTKGPTPIKREKPLQERQLGKTSTRV